MAATVILALGFGLLVGISLGLTGGGGSIFAVPLLLYGLDIPVGAAMGLSLATVGLTAGFGFLLRLARGEVDVAAGLLFSMGGMATAPLGAALGHHLPESVLLSAFALLMGYAGWHLWQGRLNDQPEPLKRRSHSSLAACHLRLGGGGAAAGLLSGLFGIGGGFIIVPTMLLATGMATHRAVATSLLVIFLISLSGVAAHMRHGQLFPMPLSAFFIVGGFTGMGLGSALGRRLSGLALRKTTAAGMWLVGAGMLAKNLNLR